MELEEILKVVTLFIGAVGGVIAAFKAVTEMQHNLRQKRIEHRWQQTSQAREFLKDIKNDYRASSALQMLDWSGRSYDIGLNETATITFDEVEAGLRTSNLSFTRKESFIRDCFDALYDHFETIEHFIRHNFVTFDDVSTPLEYYVDKIHSRDCHARFMREYGYELALAFAERFRQQYQSVKP